jgi:hypothetical protein
MRYRNKLSFLHTFEYQFSLSFSLTEIKIQGNLLYDAGNVFNNIKAFNLYNMKLAPEAILGSFSLKVS